MTEETEAPILAVWEAKFKRRKERRQHQESSGNRPDTSVVTHGQWVGAHVTLEDKVVATKFQGVEMSRSPLLGRRALGANRRPWSRPCAFPSNSGPEVAGLW